MFDPVLLIKSEHGVAEPFEHGRSTVEVEGLVGQTLDHATNRSLDGAAIVERAETDGGRAARSLDAPLALQKFMMSAAEPGARHGDCTAWRMAGF